MDKKIESKIIIKRIYNLARMLKEARQMYEEVNILYTNIDNYKKLLDNDEIEFAEALSEQETI